MNAFLCKRTWRPLLGVVAIGVLACSLGVYGAPPGHEPINASDGYPSVTGIQHAPPVYAYRASTVIATEGPGQVSGVPTSCRANADCDDCNPCTTDTCTVVFPDIDGTCTNVPIDACGACADETFCNGDEICDDSGNCRPGRGSPCDDASGTICDELGGGQQLGECVQPCDVDAADPCGDDSECNGVEFCAPLECVDSANAGDPCDDGTDCPGGYCGGTCRSLGYPCGTVAACREGFCVAGAADPGTPCEVNADCGFGGDCQLESECTMMGRCCRDDGGGLYLTCTRELRPDCEADGGRWLGVGDNPATPADEAIFGCTQVADPTQPNAGEGFSCPYYNSGITNDAYVPDMLYVGQIGHADCNAMREIGDDYTIAGGSSHYRLNTFRYIGGFDPNAGGSRVRITFYDASGNFIEDTITNGYAQGQTQLRTIIYAEQPTIPATGFVTLMAANRFSPASKHHWMGTNSATVETGSNLPGTMWMNGGPVNSDDVMAQIGAPAGTPGVLAFELTGDPVGEPLGACCDSEFGTCTNEVPWMCELAGNYHQGIGTACKACNYDLASACNSDADCPACTGDMVCANDPGTTCTDDADCAGGETGPCTQPACDPDSECPDGVCDGGTCAGGGNAGNACSVDVDCPAGETCTVTEECLTVPPECTARACCPDTPDGSCTPKTQLEACPGGTTSLGFGTNCDPNWCAQTPSGYDTCVEAAANMHVFDVAAMTGCESQETLTLTGNNSAASFNDNNPDADPPQVSCPFNMFQQGAGTDDRGWWHSFSINACANVRMDFCGTAEMYGEVKQPAWANLWNSCDPCTTTVPAAIVGDLSSGGCVGSNDANGDRGSPFCGADDLWETYGPLPAGTYWYPVYSSPAGTYGTYQLHFTVAPCATAACCLPESMCVDSGDQLLFDVDGNPIPCEVDGDCGTGNTCEECAVVNEPDCDLAEGQWNGLGSIGAGEQPNPTCDAGPGGSACALGSCCTAPGVCVDNNPNNPGSVCDNDPANCMTRADCDSLGGSFLGSAGCDDPVAPCPACTLITENNCQLVDQPGGTSFTYMSDLASPGFNGVVTADNFIPETSDLSSLCVWGAYLDPLGGATLPVAFECAGSVIDEFRVRIFADDNGLPGTVLGESLVTGANIATGPLQGTVYETGFYGVVMQGYTLTLDSPITTLIPGEVNWIEVANNTRYPVDNTCYWHWAMSLMADPVLGYAASGLSIRTGDFPQPGLERVSQYVSGSAKGGIDMAFCLQGPDGPLNFETPVEPVGACWTCPDDENPEGVCQALTLSECSNIPAVWNRLDTNCTQPMPTQPNDFCASGGAAMAMSMAPLFCGDGILDADEQCDDGNLVNDDGCDDECHIECAGPTQVGLGYMPITDGLFSLDTACATLDGPNLSTGEGGNFSFDGDIWFAYTATCTGTMLADMCATQSGRTRYGYTSSDSAMALYHEYLNRCSTGLNAGAECECPNGNAMCINPVQCPPGVDDLCPVGEPPREDCICNPGNVTHVPPYCEVVDSVCRNHCPCPGPIDGVSPLQDGLGSDESCNGIADAGAGTQQRIVFPNECWLIRSGSWLTAGGAQGTANRGRGLMGVSCQPAECTPSQPALVQMGPGSGTSLVPAYHSRWLSIVPGYAVGATTAIRVTLVDLPGQYSIWNGEIMWAGPPAQYNELPGKSAPCTTEACTMATFWASELQCEPYYTDWTLFAAGDAEWDGALHLYGEAVVPSLLERPAGPILTPATYHIQMIASDCAIMSESAYTDPLVMRTTGWCDLVELEAGTNRIPPDVAGKGITVSDTVAMLQKFAGQPGNGGLPPKHWMDLVGVTTEQVPDLDFVIDVNDLTAVLDAFSGTVYPFGPSEASSCP